MSDPETGEEPRVVIRDKRRIDPESGEVREAPGEQSPAAEPAAGEPAAPIGEFDGELATKLDESVADLKRVSAEYANYRRRTERDRVQAGELATGSVLASILPILDDIDRARAHGDLSGPFQSVAEKLESTVAGLGLQAFGDKGDPFDPNRHEAVMHEESDEVQVPTCSQVMRRGYQHRDRLLRAAMVGVAAPSSAAASSPLDLPIMDDAEEPARFDERA